MAGKKFTIKKLKLRRRASARRRKLKVSPQPKGLSSSVEQQNLEVIRSLESQLQQTQEA